MLLIPLSAGAGAGGVRALNLSLAMVASTLGKGILANT